MFARNGKSILPGYKLLQCLHSSIVHVVHVFPRLFHHFGRSPEALKGKPKLHLHSTCIFCLMVQFLVLLGIRQGSKVNRVAIDHVNEWIKVQQRLNRALNDERDELDQALHDIVMFEHRKASGVPQQVDDDESSIALEDEVEGNDESSIPVGGEIESINERVKALKLSIRKLKSAKDSAHLLCEELQLAITFRGLRMFSMRLSKILFKSLFLVFLYEVYYVTLYYILDGDMSNIYSI